MTAIRQAEYIWPDGATPTQRLRSKTRIIAFHENEPVTLAAFPTWSFDGSSTYQAAGHEPIKYGPVPVLAGSSTYQAAGHCRAGETGYSRWGSGKRRLGGVA